MPYSIEYKRTTWGRAVTLVSNARRRSKKRNVKMELTIEWVDEQLKKGACQITGIPFNLEATTEHHTRRWDAPSLDRIDKTKPYNETNTRVVLWAVNCALSEYGTEVMLPILKAMIKGIEDAQKKSTTPVSTGPDQTGRDDTEPSAISTTRAWQNGDDANDYRGATQGENSYRSAKEGSGDSMGYGSGEVGAPQAPKNSQDPGHAESTVGSVEEFFERVRSKSRELDLVTGATRDAIQQSDYRRIESLQGPLDKAFQSLEKELEELRKARNFNRNANTSGDA